MNFDKQTASSQLRVFEELSETMEGLSQTELAQRVGCDRRTIQRILKRLRELNVPIAEHVGERGSKTFRIITDPSETMFTFNEIAAVYISRRFLQPMRGTFLWEAMEHALTKMKHCLGPTMIAYLERSARVMEPSTFGWGDYRKSSEILDSLDYAVMEKRRTTILYKAFHDPKPTKTTLDPYGLITHEGSLYLVGFSHKRDEIRHWKIDRIHGITVSDDTFEIPDDFRLADYLDSMFGLFKENRNYPPQLVRIRFLEYFARVAQEKRWHVSQRSLPQSDGSVIVEMELTELAAIKRWVLQFGKYAEVLAPPELREMVLKEIDSITPFYRQDEKPLF